MEKGLRGLEALGSLELSPVQPAVDDSAVGERVAQARHRRLMTGEALGAQVGLGKDQISKIESGLRRIKVRELPSFADALGVTIGYLLGQPSQPRVAMAHRLVADSEPGSVHAIRRRALQLIEAEDLLNQRATPMPPAASAAGSRVRDFANNELASRPRNRDEAQRQGRQLAERVREELNLGGDEIGDLAGLIERHFGIDVALSPLGTDCDGLCVRGDGIALLVASSDFPGGHLRFTLAHELGHDLFGDPRDVIDERETDMFADDMLERRVNAFAGHLLMPEAGIRETLAWVSAGRVTQRALVALMERFGVSLAALVYQLVLLRMISYEEGVRLRDCRVRDLVARHRDVAPSGAATTANRAVRAPERLVRSALEAVRAEKLGLSVVAAILERDDDDELWRDYMDDDGGKNLSVTVPTL